MFETASPHSRSPLFRGSTPVSTTSLAAERWTVGLNSHPKHRGPSPSCLAMLRRQDQALIMQMPVCRRLWCLTDLHPRHPTATPVLKPCLLQSCQSPRQAAFEDLRCLLPPEERPLPVGKPTLTAAPPATAAQELVSKRQAVGAPSPCSEKRPPGSCIKGVPGAVRGRPKWARDQDNLNKGFSV